MSDLKPKILNFLHGWVNKNHVTGIRKGMVEDLEQFVLDIAAQAEITNAVAKMQHQKLVAETVQAESKEK